MLLPSALAAALSLGQPATSALPRACELHHLPIILGFESGSAELSGSARAILDHFIWPYLQARVDWPVDVVGHTDTVGSKPANRRLSMRRARAARDYLVANGIPRHRITVRGEGESSLLVPTRDEVAEENNRNVWVQENPSAEQWASWLSRCQAPGL
jgi:outer membrane protein OmpA-like peptidoglycan-associated protein